jgi:predicted nucleic acid-binding protein
VASHSSTGLIVDDRQARTIARQLGIVIHGTVGILLQAKRAQLVPCIAPILEDMRGKGYWLSDALVEAALKLSGE